MHITSHNSGSIISRCLAEFPSLVGWLFWFVLFLRKSYTVRVHYNHCLFVPSAYHLPSALWIFLIFFMKESSMLLALERGAFTAKASGWLCGDPFCDFSFAIPSALSQNMARNGKLQQCGGDLQLLCGTGLATVGYKIWICVSDHPPSFFLFCQFTWKY